MISSKDIDNWFGYHPADEDKKAKYRAIEEKAKELAALILELTPPSADQSAAIRELRLAKMTAVAAIACHDPAQ